MKKIKFWFCDYNKKYEGNEPLLYPTQQIDIARDMEAGYARLHEELKVLWETTDNKVSPGFGKYNSFDDKQFPPKSWQKMVFKVWNIRNKRICNRFPQTAALMDKYPNITSCFVTKTSPHSVIRPHCGETNAHIRIHLGLHIPDGDSSVCGIEIINQTIGWQNGKTFAFLDAHSHHVWNNSDYDRYVLIIDMLRPEFSRYKNFICARVIVSQMVFYTASLMKLQNLDRVKSGFLDILTYLLYLPVTTIILLNNRVGLFRL